MRSALRTVHVAGPAAGAARIRASLDPWLAGAGSSNPGRRASATAAANYIDVVDQIGVWHGAGGALTFEAWEMRDRISYTSTDHLTVVTRAVLREPSGGYWGRLLFWDTPRLSADAAELLAAPVVEALERRYGSGWVAGVQAWQGRTGEAYSIAPSAALARRSEVAALIAAM